MSVGGSSRLEYEQRVNRVIDHIRDHLADELSLEQLARVAAFSPFHFHRIFHGVTGETLFGFIHRVRIERAATALRDHPDDSVLAIALDHGFSSAATFARAFRARFGMSATAWRQGGAERWRARSASTRARARSKRGKANRKRGKAPARARRDGRRMDVKVTTLPRYRIAYMRHVGPYGAHGIPDLWARFAKWMETHGLLGPDSIRLGIARDDPEVTAPEQLRYDACVVVPDGFEGDKWVNVTELRASKYAVGAFAGTAHEIVGAWETLYRSWLPGSGYQPDDRPCIELYRGETYAKGKPGVFRCELCIPVRPL
jgi:AraC family transcriptional regulator